MPNGDLSISRLESPQRDQALFDSQQDAVEQSLRTGEEVEFENSNGDIIAVKVETLSSGSNGNYTVHVGDQSFSVDSEIG